jgi:hypothetical protein
MLVKKPDPPLQEGDIVFRPKESGLGFHFGTIVQSKSVMSPNALASLFPQFLVAHTMPGTGKSATTLDEFLNGKPGGTIRIPRTALERLVVEQRATADFRAPVARP